ncbi:hypothetical protein [Streptococcus mutans]|uniref:hypothetical protein n=1 Tax=Streptococcus mutans TaxID=1309 RepID=UPI001EECD505|nr:hypothetical protein [Streptococcus mutans]
MGNEISASTEKVTSQVDISKVESGKIDEQVTPTIEKSDSTKEVLPTEDTSSQTDTSETALDESR